MSRLPGIDDLEVDGKRVLVRADLNVPLEAGAVVDDFRIRAALATIQVLRERGARVIVASHLGRPKGPDPELSLAPVAVRLQELGGFPVRLAGDVAGIEAKKTVAGMEPGEVVFLENTRFHPGETKNDPELAEALAALADAFVLDAFGSAHRAHASTVGVAELLPSAASPLVQAEVDALRRLLEERRSPYVVVLGGAKVSTKIGVIEALLPRVDAMLIGGAMAFTLLTADGYDVGSSRVEEQMLGEARGVLKGPHGARVMLPDDAVVADRFAADADHKVVPTGDMPEGWMGLDIGPEAAERFAGVIANAETLFWNGPMGVFEWEAFRTGTARIAEAVVECEGMTVVGGGDTAAALKLFGLEDRVTHLSTGGGAGLEFVEGKALPGIEVLERKSDGT